MSALDDTLLLCYSLAALQLFTTLTFTVMYMRQYSGTVFSRLWQVACNRQQVTLLLLESSVALMYVAHHDAYLGTAGTRTFRGWKLVYDIGLFGTLAFYLLNIRQSAAFIF